MLPSIVYREYRYKNRYFVVEQLVTPGPNYKGDTFKHPAYNAAPSYSMGTRSRHRKLDQVSF